MEGIDVILKLKEICVHLCINLKGSLQVKLMFALYGPKWYRNILIFVPNKLRPPLNIPYLHNVRKVNKLKVEKS